MFNLQNHWDRVYESKSFDSVSWYLPHLIESINLIEIFCPDRTSAIVDIGAGESTLVDDLLVKRYLNLSVLDISSKAIEFTKKRLGKKALHVDWHVCDITNYDFGRKKFDVWHDRAFFHFLTDENARKRYVEMVIKSLNLGGYLIISTFGPEGPLQCSGLEIIRYDDQKLYNEFGEQFQLIDSHTEDFKTPFGTHQQFIYCVLKLSRH